MGELRTISNRDELKTITELKGVREPALLDTFKISWSEKNENEIKTAAEIFKRYTNEGWIAFSVMPNNTRTQIFTFNPNVPEIILIPPIGGG